MSPTISSAGMVGDRLQQRLHQQDIDHGRLVDDQQVACERVVAAAFEAAGFGIDFEQPVDGLGLESGSFGHPLGGSARRRAEQQARRPWRPGCAGWR